MGDVMNDCSIGNQQRQAQRPTKTVVFLAARSSPLSVNAPLRRREKGKLPNHNEVNAVNIIPLLENLSFKRNFISGGAGRVFILRGQFGGNCWLSGRVVKAHSRRRHFKLYQFKA